VGREVWKTVLHSVARDAWALGVHSSYAYASIEKEKIWMESVTINDNGLTPSCSIEIAGSKLGRQI